MIKIALLFFLGVGLMLRGMNEQAHQELREARYSLIQEVQRSSQKEVEARVLRIKKAIEHMERELPVGDSARSKKREHEELKQELYVRKWICEVNLKSRETD